MAVNDTLQVWISVLSCISFVVTDIYIQLEAGRFVQRVTGRADIELLFHVCFLVVVCIGAPVLVYIVLATSVSLACTSWLLTWDKPSRI